MDRTIVEKVKHSSVTAVQNVKDIIKFNFKSLIKHKMFVWATLSFFAMVLIASMVFVPYNWGVGLFFIAYLMLPCFIILGWTGYNIMTSVLYQNVRTSGIGSFSFYIAQLITIFIIGNILSLFFWPIVVLAAHFNLFILGWFDKAAQATTIFNPLSNFTWVLIIYNIQLTIMVVFSFYFVIQFWVSDIKVYYLIIVPTILLSIIFGGVINDYFTKPMGWENPDPASGEAWSMHQIEMIGGAFPDWMFWPSLLFPFYGVGQFATAAIALNATHFGIEGAQSVQFWNWFIINPLIGESWKWWLVLIQPYVVCFGFLFFGSGSAAAQRYFF